VSRGFLSSLLGIGCTLLAWFGPWEWPAWPAFAVIHLLFGTHSTFADLPYGARAVAVTGLIVVNVAVWGAVTWLLLAVARAALSHRTASPGSLVP
jgi:hypothetical protein